MAILFNYFKKLFKKVKFFYWVLILAAISALVWTLALRQPDGKMHLSLIRAGEGSTLFIQSPDGQTLLFNPGGSPNTLSSILSQSISPWNFHLDAALLSRREAAPVLSDLNERLPVRLAILTPAVYQVTDEQKALSLPEGMQIKKLGEGEAVEFGKGLTILPLASDADSTAWLLTFGQTRIFIPDGVDPKSFSQKNSADLRGLAALILSDADVANMPADMWQNYGAQVILWNSTSLAPDSGWQGLDRLQTISLSSDGKTLRVTE